MITNASTANYITKPHEIYGLSTDTKPTDVPNASAFYEMDNKKMWLYDEENSKWLEQ